MKKPLTVVALAAGLSAAFAADQTVSGVITDRRLLFRLGDLARYGTTIADVASGWRL